MIVTLEQKYTPMNTALTAVHTTLKKLSPIFRKMRGALSIKIPPRAAIKALQPQAIALFREIRFFDPTDIRERYRLHDILSCTQSFRSCSTSMQSKQLFDRLQPLRQWLFWMPVMLVKANDIGRSAMILLAQFHTLAMAIDSSIPELSSAALGALTIHATQQIDARM